MAITKQDVFRVANEIDAEGCKPSAVEVRRRLGAGSYTTITAALREWVKPEAEEAEELEPMPGAFVDCLMQAGADLYALALRITGEQMQAERDGWAAERAGIEAERDEAIRIADQASEQLDEAREVVAKAQAEEATLIAERAQAYAIAEERGRAVQLAQAEARAAQDKVAALAGKVEALEAVIAKMQPAPAKTARKAGGKAEG